MDATQASCDLPTSIPIRGVGWVLRWAAAFGVLWFAGCVLTEFACCLAAERTLGRAARAGALEATLPRANYQSVVDTVTRRLANRVALSEKLALVVHRNGAAVGGALRTVGGDRIAVTLTVPARAVAPNWLSVLSLRTGESQIEVRAERQVPGRVIGWPRRGPGI
jgi:hypothetical protein